MKLARMITLLKIIQMLRLIGQRPSKHNVAKNDCSVSRSTSYRQLGIMEKIGLIDNLEADGLPYLLETNKAENLFASYKELPL